MKTKTAAKKFWTPVRNGRTFCSPGCGGGCTIGQYNKAVKSGKALAKALGKNWTYSVWENLGWHFKAVNGSCEVYKNEHTKNLYWASLHANGRQLADAKKTPTAAVKSVLRKAYEHAHGILTDLEQFDNPFGN